MAAMVFVGFDGEMEWWCGQDRKLPAYHSHGELMFHACRMSDSCLQHSFDLIFNVVQTIIYDDDFSFCCYTSVFVFYSEDSIMFLLFEYCLNKHNTQYPMSTCFDLSDGLFCLCKYTSL